jgi:hypothetical protein
MNEQLNVISIVVVIHSFKRVFLFSYSVALYPIRSAGINCNV